MRASFAGGALSPLSALLLAAFASLPAAAEQLVARLDDGTTLARVEMAQGAGWCIHWHHSVQGFEVTDCYANRAGRMVLERSHQPDFAAGLGHIPGRGRQVSDGAGGYWILDIDEPVPGNSYVLRAGSMAVDHRLRTADAEISLSAKAARKRIHITLE